MPSQESFRINKYETKFKRIYVSDIETIAIITEMVRYKHASHLGMIVRAGEVLVDEDYMDSFLELAESLYIKIYQIENKDFICSQTKLIEFRIKKPFKILKPQSFEL